MKYATATKNLLQKENPHELQRLQSEGKLPEMLEDVEALYSLQEQDLIREMSTGLLKDLTYQEAVGRKNMLAMVAREITNNDLTEFVRALKD